MGIIGALAEDEKLNFGVIGVSILGRAVHTVYDAWHDQIVAFRGLHVTHERPGAGYGAVTSLVLLSHTFIQYKEQTPARP